MRADWINLMIAAARLPLRSDLANNHRAPECPWPYLVLNLVVVDGHSPIVQVARKRYPASQAVIEGFSCD